MRRRIPAAAPERTDTSEYDPAALVQVSTVHSHSNQRPEDGRSPPSQPWRIALDTGGTFTDAIGIAPDGQWHRVKVPSDGSIPCRAWRVGPRSIRLEPPPWLPQPDRFLRGMLCCIPGEDPLRLGESHAGVWQVDRAPLHRAVDEAVVVRVQAVDEQLDAPLIAIFAMVGLTPADPLPPIEVRLSTTRGTNALLERRGAPTLLAITEGFEDLLSIGDQSRPDLFARAIIKPPPLHAAVLGLPERALVDGTRRRSLTQADLDELLRAIDASAVESVVVACLHGLTAPAEEARIVDFLLKERPHRTIVGASAVSASPRFLSRVETAIVHASLTPVIRSYLAKVARRVPIESTFMMTSAGGLQRSDRYLARDCLLSGPAGGIAGVAEVGRRTQRNSLLGFDMGGTSTDVARCEGRFHYRFESRVGNARVATPSLAIESVAAGGGSICSVVHGELRVGPESAGARPGPACYGNGGPFTLTDVNLLLGRMDHERSSLPLSIAAAERACDALVRASGIARDELLRAFLEIADERIAGAVQAVTVREGADPREYTLVPFGGAGGQHACALADRLGITDVLFPQDAGILSARGVLGAHVERFASRAILERLDPEEPRLNDAIDRLDEEAIALLRDECSTAPIAIAERMVSLRLEGHENTIDLRIDENTPASVSRLASAFHQAFERLFGYAAPNRPLIVEAVRSVARASTIVPPSPRIRTTPTGTSERSDRRSLRGIPIESRADLPPGATLVGPLLIVDHGATAFLAEGWQATVAEEGDILARRVTGHVPLRPGAGELDLFACRLEAIATAMGELLRRTAFSTNVKERLDYSCAVLDHRGTLLQNAPHLPVHLGAMGVCVRAVVEHVKVKPGDVVITNHPAFGGSHLPDVTIITPVFSHGTLLGYVATRAHHAEIGGTRPGSFPPNAESLAEEGVVLPPILLVDGGQPRLEVVAERLTKAPYPTRALEENLADIQASVAANELGRREFLALAERYSQTRFFELGEALLARADLALRTTLKRIPAGTYEATERLDDGSPIAVRVTIADGQATIDFTGSAPVHRRNFNAPAAVVRAATLYALRLLVNESVPMNEGLLRPIRLLLPEGMLSPPFAADPTLCPPVVAGNTETSQRVTDALLRAFALAACSQGTMNNLLFGNARFSAYETIAGGSGATVDTAGADAVHTHMTNTRITDPEVLERRCPVVLRTFAIRRGSGGAGARRGGDGVIREIEFLEPTQVSLLAQHRVERPYGLAGGGPGAAGAQYIVRRDGRREPIAGVTAVDLTPGEAIRIESPGGGGWGRAQDNES